MNGITNASAIVATLLERGHAISGVVTLTLAHFIWQGIIVAMLFGLANWLLRKRSASARYIVSVVALFALLACPTFTFSLLLTTNSSVPTRQMMLSYTWPSGTSPSVPMTVSVGRSDAVGVASDELRAATRPLGRVERWMERFSPIVSTVYLFGVIAMVARLRRGLASGRNCRNVATISRDPTLHERIVERCQKWSMRFVPVIACCQQVSVPVVVGVTRPMILIPPAILSGFTIDQIESMLVHELAHIRRWDPFVHLIQRIAESLLFFHPAVWYVSRRMSIEREIACDDFVTAAGWAPQDYAATLLALADRFLHVDPESKAILLAASGGGPSQFKLRILRLLGEDRPNQLIDVNRREVVFSLLLFVAASAALFGRSSVQANMLQLGNVDRGVQAEVQNPPPNGHPPAEAGHSSGSTVAAIEAAVPVNPEEATGRLEPLEGEFCVSEVVFEGLTTLPVVEVEKQIKTKAGRRFSQKQIKDDVDALVRTRWFASVEPTLRPSPAGDVLVFQLLERPIVRRVEYKGLKKVKQKVFDNLTQLRPGSPFDVASNRENARRIEEYYHDKGYAFATVELEKGNERDDREVIFRINEGPKVKVSSVQFQGNDESSNGLQRAMTRKRILNLWLFGGQYDSSTIADDIDDVKRYYHMLGYFDVEVKEHLKFSDDKSRVEIHYEVAEGIRYKFGKIDIEGNVLISEEDLRQSIKVREGTYFNSRDIRSDVRMIQSKYAELGRSHCRISLAHDKSQSGILNLGYHVNEGIADRDLVREIGPVPIEIGFSTPLIVPNLSGQKLKDKTDGK